MTATRLRNVAALLSLTAISAAGAATLLPARVREISALVEQVRGRRFQAAVPASEIEPPALRRFLRHKLDEAFPASPEETIRSLEVLGLIDRSPNLIDRLLDFYTAQVVAFYDPEPRRFYVVRGGAATGAAEELGAGDLAERLLYSHELTHALQDQHLRLDGRFKSLRDDGDRALALQSLLEGEATLVMVRVALRDIPGADEAVEEALAPLLSAGALEKANAPKDLPPFFVEQLFFPYVEGTAYVRHAVARGGWKEIDRLWTDPPLSTAEILHRERRPPPATDLLPADPAALARERRLLYSDTIGEWTIRFLLKRSLPEEEAAEAASGWRGDRIAFFAGGEAMPYVWRIRFDTPGSALRFERALSRTRDAAGSRRIARHGTDVVVSAGLTRIPPLPGIPAISSPPE